MPAGIPPLRPARRRRKPVAVAGRGNRRACGGAQAVRHLRPRPQRFRQPPERHCETADQARPGVQPHPCRRHRRCAMAPRRAGTWQRLQRHRRPSGAAAGCGDLCRRADGYRAAARNSFRFRPTFAHGAVFLWREQARFERGGQGGRLSFPLSGLPFGVRRNVGGRRLERRGRRRRKKRNEEVVIEAIARKCYG